jgi:hypothetical protein
VLTLYVSGLADARGNRVDPPLVGWRLLLWRDPAVSDDAVLSRNTLRGAYIYGVRAVAEMGSGWLPAVRSRATRSSRSSLTDALPARRIVTNPTSPMSSQPSARLSCCDKNHIPVSSHCVVSEAPINGCVRGGEGSGRDRHDVRPLQGRRTAAEGKARLA